MDFQVHALYSFLSLAGKGGTRKVDIFSKKVNQIIERIDAGRKN
jgi:hypothetical protein